MLVPSLKNRLKALDFDLANNLMQYPPKLTKGSRIKIISTARKVSPEEMELVITLLESWGLKVELGHSLYSSKNQFAGSDEERQSDLQSAIDDSTVGAIFCARGGYGTPRIIDKIDMTGLIKYPKWIVGFSDMTVLLQAAHLSGVVSLHAPIALYLPKPEYISSVATLKQFLFGQNPNYQIAAHPFNKKGQASGTLVGGSLSLLVNSIGTRTGFDPLGKILFLEDLDEYLYHLDRMILHLKRASILSDISGLIIGHFSSMRDNTVPFGASAYEIFYHYVKEYNYPISFGFPVGHEAPNMPLPVGATSKLTVNEQGTLLEFL